MRAAPVVHLELHTGDRHGAGALYSQLLGWRPERIDTESGQFIFYRDLNLMLSSERLGLRQSGIDDVINSAPVPV